MTDVASLPLPPGSTGWPLLGEAAALADNPFHFMRDRAAKHGAVTRSKLLAQDLAILAGPDAAAVFLDEANVRRAGGLPPHAAALFGAGVVNQIDGDAHRRRKRHLMRALDREALAHYLPAMRAKVRGRLKGWASAGEMKLQDASVLLTMELILGDFVGLTRDDVTLARYAQGYADFGMALVGLPFALPGTPLARTRVFNAEMHATFREVIAQRRAAPTGDGVSRLIASEVDGQRLADDDLVLEMQHMIFAATGLWGWFCHGARALAEDPALAATLREAVAALPADPDGRALLACDALLNFAREVKRTAMLIPITAIGVAERDFAVAGHRVPKGWLVLWTTFGSHVVPGVAPYASPERFDPARYARGEGEGAHHFAPQGPGEALTSHRCAGVEYSTLALLLFFSELLRGPALTLLPQDLSMRMGSFPASYKGGLRVRFG